MIQSPFSTQAANGHTVPDPESDNGLVWSSWWNGGWQGDPKYSGEIFPGATLSTTNPTWIKPGPPLWEAGD
jgi:hypothetical protein